METPLKESRVMRDIERERERERESFYIDCRYSIGERRPGPR